MAPWVLRSALHIIWPLSRQQSPALLPLTRFRNTACQTDPEPKVSVATQFCHYMVSVGTQTSYSPSTRCAATQLSYNTLKQHVRSKGGYECHTL